MQFASFIHELSIANGAVDRGTNLRSPVSLIFQIAGENDMFRKDTISVFNSPATGFGPYPPR